MGLLCNLVYRYKCLCDYGPHSLHWQHRHKDLHISRCDKQELLDILDLLNIRRACILHRDYLCVQQDIDIWLCVR